MKFGLGKLLDFALPAIVGVVEKKIEKRARKREEKRQKKVLDNL